MKSGLLMVAFVAILSGCVRSNRPDSTATRFSGASSAIVSNGATNESRATNSQDVIKAGDTLLITFTNSTSIHTVPEFDQRVRDDGTITLIYGNVFHAAGKKTGDLEKEIRDFFVPIFTNYTVVIRRSSGSFVCLDGEFGNPGRYSWTNGMRLRDAIDLAHGFSDFAGRLTLIHADGAKQRIRLPANKIPVDNPKLKAGDVIRCRGRDI